MCDGLCRRAPPHDNGTALGMSRESAPLPYVGYSSGVARSFAIDEVVRAAAGLIRDACSRDDWVPSALVIGTIDTRIIVMRARSRQHAAAQGKSRSDPVLKQFVRSLTPDTSSAGMASFLSDMLDDESGVDPNFSHVVRDLSNRRRLADALRTIMSEKRTAFSFERGGLMFYVFCTALRALCIQACRVYLCESADPTDDAAPRQLVAQSGLLYGTPTHDGSIEASPDKRADAMSALLGWVDSCMATLLSSTRVELTGQFNQYTECGVFMKCATTRLLATCDAAGGAAPRFIVTTKDGETREICGPYDGACIPDAFIATQVAILRRFALVDLEDRLPRLPDDDSVRTYAAIRNAFEENIRQVAEEIEAREVQVLQRRKESRGGAARLSTVGSVCIFMLEQATLALVEYGDAEHSPPPEMSADDEEEL